MNKLTTNDLYSIAQLADSKMVTEMMPAWLNQRPIGSKDNKFHRFVNMVTWVIEPEVSVLLSSLPEDFVEIGSLIEHGHRETEFISCRSDLGFCSSSMMKILNNMPEGKSIGLVVVRHHGFSEFRMEILKRFCDRFAEACIIIVNSLAASTDLERLYKSFGGRKQDYYFLDWTGVVIYSRI